MGATHEFEFSIASMKWRLYNGPESVWRWWQCRHFAKLNRSLRLINEIDRLWSQMKGITDSKLSHQMEFQFLHFAIFGKLIKFG